MKTKPILSFIFIILSITACNTTEPPPPGEKPTLLLKLEDVSCTEAWIELTTTNLQLPATVILKQTDPTGNTKSQISILNTKDSLLYVDSLLPNQSYTFIASHSGLSGITSNELSVTTLDTTSQNFSFEVLEFGDGFESSYFNDVWTFNENNIWAVGYISPSDTIVNGTPIINPNIIRWNGIKWELEPFNGTSSGISGIWAVSSSKIYFANGIVLKYDNGSYEYEDFSNVPLPGGQAVHKLWGSSENNIYGVGPWGTIVRYDGAQWTKIEFDTQWYFYAITGNETSGIGYAVAINQFDDCIVIKINNSSVSIIYQKSLSDIKVASRTITEKNSFLYIVGSDLQSTKICRVRETDQIKILHQLSPYIGIIQSYAQNNCDIYYFGVEGSEARLVHFNGVNYKIFNIPQIDPDNYGGIHSVENLAASVGYSNNKAYIIKIRR